MFRPVYGLIFLFKYVGSGMELGDPEGAGPDDGIGVFFAQQIINNACATQVGSPPVELDSSERRQYL